MAGVTRTFDNQVMGYRMPWGRGIILQWVDQNVEAARKVTNTLSKLGPPLDPALAKFQQTVVESPHLLRLANDMFTETSNKCPNDLAGGCSITSFNEFMAVLELVIQSGPESFEETKPETAMEFIGFPINAILYWTMGTYSGYDFFLRPEVNEALRELFDTFYLKGQPYSLGNMLKCNARTAEFVGETVYQAFLSAQSYHRSHAPVSGRVVAIESVPGTYYSENWVERMAAAEDRDNNPDPMASDYSQPYISAVATRSIIYIEARDLKIVLMAILFIGMAEVSAASLQ